MNENDIFTLEFDDLSYKMYLPFAKTDFIQRHIFNTKKPYECRSFRLTMRAIQMKLWISFLDVLQKKRNVEKDTQSVRSYRVRPRERKLSYLSSIILILGSFFLISCTDVRKNSKQEYIKGCLYNVTEVFDNKYINVLCECQADFVIDSLSNDDLALMNKKSISAVDSMELGKLNFKQRAIEQALMSKKGQNTIKRCIQNRIGENK